MLPKRICNQHSPPQRLLLWSRASSQGPHLGNHRKLPSRQKPRENQPRSGRWMAFWKYSLIISAIVIRKQSMITLLQIGLVFRVDRWVLRGECVWGRVHIGMTQGSQWFWELFGRLKRELLVHISWSRCWFSVAIVNLVSAVVSRLGWVFIFRYVINGSPSILFS